MDSIPARMKEDDFPPSFLLRPLLQAKLQPLSSTRHLSPQNGKHPHKMCRWPPSEVQTNRTFEIERFAPLSFHAHSLVFFALFISFLSVMIFQRPVPPGTSACWA